MGFDKRLDAWLCKQLFSTADTGPVEKIVVRHLSVGNSGQEIESIDCPANINEETIRTLKEDITQLIEGDADGLPGDVQSYMVQVWRKDKPRGRITIRIMGELADSNGYDSEPANKTGHLAQLMRHNEVIIMNMVKGQSQVQYAMGRMIERLIGQNESMEQHRLDNLELTEALLTNKHERELDLLAEERKDKNSAELISSVKLLGPALVNRLSKNKDGESLLPESDTPNELAVKALLDSLTDEQKTSFLGTLGPTQKVALMELFRSVQKH